MLKQHQLADVSFHTATHEPDELSTTDDYESLTPSIIVPEESDVYMVALNFACSRSDIRNIALTGAYGAGKSSVLRTWKECPDNDLRIMTVSLADFEMQSAQRPKSEPAEKDGTTNSADDKKAAAEEKTIEYSILQQLLYKEKKSALPYSRIERISDITSIQVAAIALHLLLIMCFTLGGLFFLFPDYIRRKLWLPESVSTYMQDITAGRFVVAGVLFFAALFMALKKLHRIGLFDRRVSVEKIDMLKGAISTRVSSPSLLNVYIDEIVYFFEKTGHNVVIFEDLDRHNDGAIFIKLREINQIINSTRTDVKPVRFIYAIRDGLFSTAEARTKFFDFVIPVVPVMDSENAAEHFNSMFREEELDIEGFKKCVSQLSMFIPDMRIMRNIANEFRIYQNMVNGSGNIIRLLSMISYKNICADDYHGIDEKKGVLYSFVKAFVLDQLKPEYINNKVDEIRKTEREIDSLQHDEAGNLEEIRIDILSDYISPVLKEAFMFSLPGQGVIDIESLSGEDGGFENLLSMNSFGLWHKQSRREIHTFDKTSINAIAEDYIKRKEILRQKNEGYIGRLRERIVSIKREINNVNRSSLSDFAIRMESAGFEIWVMKTLYNEKPVSENHKKYADQLGFIYFLISNRYIDSDYMFYRSVFRPGSLSSEDNEFVKAVSIGLSRDKTSYMPLNMIGNVVSKLDSLGLLTEQRACHPDVLLFLLENEIPSLRTIVQLQIDDIEDNSLKFLAEQIFGGWTIPHKIQYVELMSSDTDKSFNYVKRLSELKEKNIASELLILHLISPSVYWPSQSSQMRAWAMEILDDNGRFPDQIPENHEDTFIINMNKTKMFFYCIDECVTPQGCNVVRAIAENRRWDYSFDNLRNIFYTLCNLQNFKKNSFLNTPLSAINELGIKGLEETIQDNIDQFIRDFILRSEDYDRIPEILNNDKVDYQIIYDIIFKMNFTVDDISKIKNREGATPFGNYKLSYYIHTLLISNDRVKLSWGNVFYLAKKEDDEGDISPELAIWFDRNIGEFDDPRLPLSDEHLHLIFKILFNSGAMSDNGRISILKFFGFPYPDVPAYMLFDSVRCLINQRFINASQENFEDIRQRFSDEPEKRAPLLAGLIFQNPSLLQFPEVVIMDDNVFDGYLAEQLFLDGSLADTVQAKILTWIWDYNKEVFLDSLCLSAARLALLAPHLESENLRRTLLLQSLKAGDVSHEAISRIIASFSDPAVLAFASDAKFRSMALADDQLELARHLESAGFIRSLNPERKEGRFRFTPHNSPALRSE